MKKSYLFLLILLSIVCITGDAFADNTVFSGLASKASRIGRGLRDTGFLIAGFGLIVFSFMAIFNKISWKMLAYIMFSTFILSTMVGVIGYVSGYQAQPQFGDVQSTGPGGESQDPTQAEVDRETGEVQVGGGTGGPLNVVPTGEEQIYDGGTVPEVVVTPDRNGQENQGQQNQPTEPDDETKNKLKELMGNDRAGTIDLFLREQPQSVDDATLERHVEFSKKAIEYMKSLPPEVQQSDYIKEQMAESEKMIQVCQDALKKRGK